MIRFSEYKLILEQYETHKRNYNNILKKMGVMNDMGEVDLINMTNKINDFLRTDDNKEKFLKDVDNKDIKGEKVKLEVKNLKPGQTSVYLDQIFKRLLEDSEFTKKCLKGKMKDRDILISSDNYIVDGHLRCTSAFILNPESKIKCTQINLPIEIAIPILNSILKATESDDAPETGNENYNIYNLVKSNDSQERLLEIIDEVSEGLWSGKKRIKKIWKLLDKVSPKTMSENLQKLPKPSTDLADRSDMPQLKDKVEDVID